MKPPISRIISISASLALLVFLAACGGKDTVASKSARAFREAQQKGIPVGGDAHGGHAAGDTAATATDHATMTGMDHSTMTGMDHATMTGMDHSTMTGTDHSQMQHGQSTATMDHSRMAGMDHSRMQHGQKPMAGMDHSQMQHGQSPTTGMDHSQMQHGQQPAAAMDHSRMQHGQPTTGMDHSQMQHGQQPMAGMDHATMPGMQHGAAAAPVVIPPPTSNAEIQRLRPAATLKDDPFDAPAQTALAEAAKAVQGRGDEGLARGIAPGEDRENPPTPAPAIRDMPAQGSTSAPAMDHSQHGGQSTPAAEPRRQPRATTPSTAQPATATIYTCPMHPEVTSDKPGTCPKCGMALVKKAVKKQ